MRKKTDRLLLMVAPAIVLSLTSCHSPKLQVVYESNSRDSATALHQQQVYHLKKKAVHADFTYHKLADIDANIGRALTPTTLMPAFAPVNGPYNYYLFQATFQGEAYHADDSEPAVKNFHDILIIKTNDDHRIIDAYHYTMEWAEVPLQHDLFRLSQPGLTLKNGLNIKDLKLARTDYWTEADKFLTQTGILKLL